MASDRISSIDIMRGLTLLLMLFVNDLNMDVAPAWLGHMEADFDGMGLADWVFPGFLFMVGMAVPFSFSKRISGGQSFTEISKHIITRTVSLLIIGILMLNTGRVNPELTGMSRNLWALLMYIAVFLIWNNYQDKDKIFTVTGFKLVGIGILILLVFKFRSGMPENDGSLITGWWGILGLIGWGYIVSAATYLACRDSLLRTSAVAIFFLSLNILDGSGYTGFFDSVRPVLGIVIQGNVPFIVLSGLIGGLILRKIPSSEYRKMTFIFAGLGIIFLVSGFVLRKWFIISKIMATPSWGMICAGISFIVHAFLYWITDVKGKTKWAFFFRLAGENSLTTYLAPNILYHLIWMSGIPVLIYKKSSEPLLVIAGSLIWALLMAALAALLARVGIKLRLR